MSHPYASVDDFRELSGVGSYVAQDSDEVVVERLLSVASSVVDGYLSVRYPTPLAAPLVAKRVDVRRTACHVAAWDFMCSRGWNPELAPAGDTVKTNYDNAMRWLERVANGTINIGEFASGADQSTQPFGGATINSEPLRGW